MTQPTFNQGWGYIEGGKRYGYTDGSLYYLGEPRIMLEYSPALRFVALTYPQLQTRVDAWTAIDPAARRTEPTREISKLDHHFGGPPRFPDSTKYIYNQLGVPSPSLISIPDDLVRVFSDKLKGITGIGLGFVQAGLRYRAGLSYKDFFYRGECRVFRISDIPTTAIRVPAPSGYSTSGIEYFKATDPHWYMRLGTGENFIMFDWVPFMNMIDSWETSNLPARTVDSYDIIQHGFFFTGQRYWQLSGGQCIPDDFVNALNEPFANLHVILRYLPGGMSSSSMSLVKPVTVTLPQRSRYSGLDFTRLLALSLFAQGKKRR